MEAKTQPREEVNSDPVEHVIVQYGNRGVLCLSHSQYEAHVARNRLITVAPAPRRDGIIAQAASGVRS